MLRGTLLAASLVPLLGGGLAPWTGTYAYQGRAGFDGGGTEATGNPIMLAFTLTIGRGCEVAAQGYQTDARLVCTLTARSGSGVDVRYAGVVAGNEAVGLPPLEPGAVLFSLVKEPGGLVTIWGRLKPSFVPSAEGHYFARVLPTD